METLQNMRAYFLKPINYSNQVLIKGIEATTEESSKARMCFIAQIISSLISIPTLLLISLATLAKNLYEGEEIAPTIQETGRSFKQLVALSLPVSVVGIFAPLATTEQFAASMNAYLFSKFA